MEFGGISDEQITASSQTTGNHASRYGRLRSQVSAGAWSAGSLDASQWLQIDLAVYTGVTGLATQGRYSYNQWVTTYKVQHSHDGVNFQYYTVQGQIKVK